MPSVPPIVRVAYAAVCVSVTVAMLYLPDLAHVNGHGAKLLTSLGIALVLCLAMLTPIEAWRHKIAPESFRNGTTVRQQVLAKTTVFLLLAFIGRVAFAWIDAT